MKNPVEVEIFTYRYATWEELSRAGKYPKENETAWVFSDGEVFVTDYWNNSLDNFIKSSEEIYSD